MALFEPAKRLGGVLLLPTSAEVCSGASNLPLLLVVPVAAVGRSYGLWPAGVSAAAALAIAIGLDLASGAEAGPVGYLGWAVAFLTVAILAGRPPKYEAGLTGAAVKRREDEEPAHPPPESVLTDRELQVLGMLAGGATNAEIADSLVISASTVKSHVKHILRKLEARNRTEAASRLSK